MDIQSELPEAPQSPTGINAVVDNFDIDLFRAKVHFDLRHSRLSSDNWEKIVADATHSKWVKGSVDLADVVNSDAKVSISVKTRKVKPTILVRKPSRDFISEPEAYHHGGIKFCEDDLDNMHTVSGRCSIPGLDEQNSSKEDIGAATMKRYHDFENASLKKFGCDDTLDIVIVHGKSCDKKRYLLRVMFFNHTLNDIVEWQDCKFEGEKSKYKGHRSMILGNDANGPHIARIGNLGRQQTCMIRFYRKEEAIRVLDLSVPMPFQEEFSYDSEMELMAQEQFDFEKELLELQE